MKIKIGHLYYVKWVDSSGSNGWQLAATINRYPLEPLPIHSVGWVLKESKYAILIASHVSDSNEAHPQEICGELIIPKCAIRKTKQLKLGKIKLLV